MRSIERYGAIGASLVFCISLAHNVVARDLHRLWDGRCETCHGHSADFAREHLRVSNGRLIGRHHEQNLKEFLANHYLAGKDVDAVYDMLRAQAQTRARFREECSNCHGRAADFVRSSLTIRSDGWYGIESGKNIREFMQRHQGLSRFDADFFSSTLERIANEVHGPEPQSPDRQGR